MRDPIEDALRYAAECEDAYKKYPTCDCCGEPITGETFYEINGKKYCEECLADFRHYTEDYIKDEDF